MEKIFIVIDGTIGSGKSTFIEKHLLPHLKSCEVEFCLINEPVDKWEKSGRLNDFYKDQKKRAYQFQTMAFHDRIIEANKVIEKNPNAKIIISERSIFSDRVFMDVLLKNNTIDKTEHEDYFKLWSMWSKLLDTDNCIFYNIYLEPSFETTIKRINVRSRKSESKIDSGYLKILYDAYRNYYNENACFLKSKNSSDEDTKIILEKIGNIII